MEELPNQAIAAMEKLDIAVDPTLYSPQEEASSRNDYNSRLTKAIMHYLLNEAQVPEFQRLYELRKRGWEAPGGDTFFAKQRRISDKGRAKTAVPYYRIMQEIAFDMNRATGILEIKASTSDADSPPAILDLCMAPGGFLATALNINPTAQALTFTLAQTEGGDKVVLELHKYNNVTAHFLDITMLATDMGIPAAEFPPSHPDIARFLPVHFDAEQRFDLALCDGLVLRTQARAAYREKREATRLILTQLILSLEHLKPGGTMIVLLHRIEAPNAVQLLYAFEKFSTLRVYKHAHYHAKRSSFYMLASDVKTNSKEARELVERWKRVWRAATLDVDGDDEMFRQVLEEGAPRVEDILVEFGERLVSMGRGLWETQASALEDAPFMKKNSSRREGWRS
ncbi:hypothetical protein BDW72DRAFT_195930 [Aspergillus terricola var. indicus]